MLLVNIGDRDCFIALANIFIILVYLILTVHIETGCFPHRNEPIIEELFLLRELFDYACLLKREHILAAKDVECG